VLELRLPESHPINHYGYYGHIVFKISGRRSQILYHPERRQPLKQYPSYIPKFGGGGESRTPVFSTHISIYPTSIVRIYNVRFSTNKPSNKFESIFLASKILSDA